MIYTNIEETNPSYKTKPFENDKTYQNVAWKHALKFYLYNILLCLNRMEGALNNIGNLTNDPGLNYNLKNTKEVNKSIYHLLKFQILISFAKKYFNVFKEEKKASMHLKIIVERLFVKFYP